MGASSFLARISWLPIALSLGCSGAEPDELDDATGAAPATAQIAADTRVENDEDLLACGQPAKGPAKRLLDVGHDGPITTLVRFKDRIYSQDSHRWVLWNVRTGKQLASGPFQLSYSWTPDMPASARGPSVIRGDLEDIILITPGKDFFDLRISITGDLITRIHIDPRRVTLSGVAKGARYVYVASDERLRMWDQGGSLVNELAGSFDEGPFVFADERELRVANDASHTIVRMDTAGKTSSTPEYEGDFHQWFLDGSHFITRTSTTFRVYDASGVMKRELPFPPAPTQSPIDLSEYTAGGDGGFVWVSAWTKHDVLVYGLDGGEPVTRFVGRALGTGRTHQTPFDVGPNRVRFLQLQGSTPQWVDREVPEWDKPTISVDAKGAWALGESKGTLYAGDLGDDAPPMMLGCGALMGLTGAGGKVALATADQRLRIYDISTGKPQLERLREGWPARRLAYADDGRFLVLQSRSVVSTIDDRSIRVHDATSGELVHAWPEEGYVRQNDPRQVGFVTATHTDRLARIVCDALSPRTCTVHVAKLDGTELFETPSFYIGATLTWNDSVALSPNGRRLAIASRVTARQVLIYEDGVLVATIPDASDVAWADDERLLIGRPRAQGGGMYMHLADPRGNTTKELPVSIGPGWPTDDNTDYFFAGVDIYRVADGVSVWQAFRSSGMNPIANPMTAIWKKNLVFAATYMALFDTLP